jgi:hypothetical protein
MDDLNKWMEEAESRVVNEEPFRVSARCYSAMYHELTTKEPKVPQSAATQIIVAHIDMVGSIGNGQTEGR